MLDAYRLDTHLGAYLSRLNHFCPNGAVGFVTTNLEVLDAYADASGKYSTKNDTVLTVSGCLSTGAKWVKFDLLLQAYLKEERFKPYKDTGRYVFHTAKFLTRNCKWMPDGLLKKDVNRIYLNVVKLVRKYSEYCFGFAVSLDGFRRIEEEFPHFRGLFGQPGTFVTRLCFARNTYWALDAGFNSKIGYMFDRGDEFWSELGEEYRKARRLLGSEEIGIPSLADGDKAEFSPLQAADVVAWECRNYWASLSTGHLSGLVTMKRGSSALNHLRIPGKSDFQLLRYEDIKKRLLKYHTDVLERSPDLMEIFRTGGYDDIEEIARVTLKLRQDDKEAKKNAELANFFEKRKRRREENDQKET